MKYVKILFKDGNTIETAINGTHEEIENYYVGKCFNFDETMVKAIAVEIDGV